MRQARPNDSLDCAQGVFHDYWIAVAGLDGTRRAAGTVTSPRKLCAAQPSRTCASAGTAHCSSGRRRAAHSASGLLATCSGLHGLQLAGCLTGASLIRSDDPLEQLPDLRGPRRRGGADCLRGLRVQTYALAPFATKLGLIRGLRERPHRAGACYAWLGKTLNVITNGTFETKGCSKPPLRRHPSGVRAAAPARTKARSRHSPSRG